MNLRCESLVIDRLWGYFV